jgi:ATP-dependent RNA helicase RhlE
MSTETKGVTGFESLGIAPKLLQILQKNNYTKPTPIQEQAIPIAIAGDDVIGIAQTGTGKTLAFGLPMIQRLAGHKGKGLVVLPTRELALQVEESLHKIGAGIGLKTAVLIGGEAMGKQLRSLKADPHIIIATPGRLIDHVQQKSVSLSLMKILVLDEADRMLDMGFAPQIKQILQHLPTQRQTMLFSATMPDQIVKIAASYMQSPTRIEVARAGTTAKNITQEVFIVHQKEKINLLEQLLKDYQGTILVFTRTKFGAKKVTRVVNKLGHTANEIHSNRSLAQRKDALEGFKNGRYRVLIATDIAARGIDVTGITLVINYDLPEHAEDYVHRIGRTARAGQVGKAISFATPEQRGDIRNIERLINMTLTSSKADISTTSQGATLLAENSQREQPRVSSYRTPRPSSRPPFQRSNSSFSKPGRSFDRKRTDGNQRPERSGSPRKPFNSQEKSGKIYWHSTPK